MFFDRGFVGAAAVFGGGRGREVPFDTRGTTYEGDVI